MRTRARPGRPALLAGIVLVDLLSTGGMTGPQVVIFTALFFMALLFQRFVPAT